MKLYHTRVFFIYLVPFSIVISIAETANQDICESCKHVDDCARYGGMTKEQQEQWMQEFSCDPPESREGRGRAVPGFSVYAKGDFVCCPSSKVWGIQEDNAESEAERQTNDKGTEPHSFYVPRYLWYQNQNQPSQPNSNLPFGRSHLYEQPRVKPEQNQNNLASNNYYGNNQCVPQSSPPKPESGCCGVDTSDGDRITDLQEFLQFKLHASNSGPQNNYPHYPRTLFRTVRDADENDLDITFDNRIAGGMKTNLDQYPWTAFISITFVKGNLKKNFICGGSLISSRFVLSAAHCMVNDNDELANIDVTLAEYDKRTFPRDCVTDAGHNQICIDNLRIPAEDVIIHPNFVEQFLINDIALVRLRNYAPYTRYIRPVCLPPINIDSPQFSNLPLATAGWGLNMTVQSDVKQFTVVHMVPKSECKAHYNRLTDGHICASGKRTEDTCKGDSGGPLMMMYQGKYYVVGIVSGKTSAFNCGTPVPSLYTNVYTYLDWIRNYVR